MLSTRERETVLALADGKLVPEIADELKITQHTVRTYIDGAKGKLSGTDMASLVNSAYETGALRTPAPEPGSRRPPLSDAQRGIAEGHTIQHIADQQARPVAHVRRDGRALLTALGAKNAAHAVKRGHQLGLLHRFPVR
ncbi:response regulator transcription factor [Streptomyces meridianus]|uniref:LuxR C-terminal-related transcriptional regulator n=1 Tax=Streptomyces meridianus TaxID=2938945 RepID=A0ABT0X1B8_9ACTN|nr:LuxR C-terminal-related transcriptional regulator [Streptomyces meridianus]MCM2576354.1 LuxR C-terminal-related transcriptional regulator [Streptomyces meridianus]